MKDKKKNEFSRKHHYVPKFHLTNFTKKGTVDSKLWVFDQTSGKQWDCRPHAAAYENDFYTVEVEGVEGPEKSDGFEQAFSVIESKAADIIRNLLSSMKMPEGDDFIWLMNYVALLAERTPVRRDTFTAPMTDLSKMMLRMTLQDEDTYKQISDELEKKTGETINVPYEKMVEFVESDRYTISYHNNQHLENMMVAIDAIIPCLLDRKWSIMVVPPTLGDLICSDNPVSLRFLREVQGPFRSPGYGLKKTEVTVPLSSRIALLGRFEETLPQLFTINKAHDLAVFNSYTGMYSKRFIFSRKPDFIWYSQDGKVCDKDDFTRMLIDKRKADNLI